jgi:hypothetical protein
MDNVLLEEPKVKPVRFLRITRSLRYLFKKLIFLVTFAMFKQESFIAPLLELAEIVNELGEDKFRMRNMRISHVLKLAYKLIHFYYNFNESEDDFKERFRQILNTDDLEKLLNLRRQVDSCMIKRRVISLKVFMRDIAEGVCPILDDREMRNLHRSKYFIPLLYATCDYCGCQIDSSVNNDTWRKCPDCKGKI